MNRIVWEKWGMVPHAQFQACSKFWTGIIFLPGFALLSASLHCEPYLERKRPWTGYEDSVFGVL